LISSGACCADVAGGGLESVRPGCLDLLGVVGLDHADDEGDERDRGEHAGRPELGPAAHDQASGLTPSGGSEAHDDPDQRQVDRNQQHEADREHHPVQGVEVVRVGRVGGVRQGGGSLLTR
jgi:hypothetical protein